MKRYKYAIVDTYAFSDVRILCTDPDRLNSILTGLQKIRPDCQVRAFEQDLEGVAYSTLIQQKGKDKVAAKDIEWWIIRQLCDSGWKPIGAAIPNLKRD